MGRTSTKENKNSYQLAREELGLTREKANDVVSKVLEAEVLLRELASQFSQA